MPRRWVAKVGSTEKPLAAALLRARLTAKDGAEYTQTDVQRGTGIIQKSISDYERGTFIPSTERLRQLADFYGNVSFGELYELAGRQKMASRDSMEVARLPDAGVAIGPFSDALWRHLDAIKDMEDDELERLTQSILVGVTRGA